MQPNRRKYLLFHKLKFHWICCKYTYIVIDQIKYIEQYEYTDFDDNEQERTERKETIDFETTDLTVPNVPNPGYIYPGKTEPTVTVERGPSSAYLD